LIGIGFDVTGGQPLGPGELSASITIKNQNGFWFLDDAGSFQIAVYLSPDATIGNAGDILIGSATIPGLGAGQTTSLSLPLTVAATDPFRDDNDYRMGVVIDYTGQVSESNETNNSNRGNGLDVEQVWFENHVSRPVNPNYPFTQPLSLNQPISAAIGDERIGALDLDTYSYVTPNTPQTIVFDLDGVGFASNLRLYTLSGQLVAQNSGGVAPGEPDGPGESLIRCNLDAAYYIVVSALGNHTSDPRTLSGRQAAGIGSYTLNAVLVPSAPTTPDLTLASDSGLSNTDNITNASSLSFRFSGAPNKIGQIYVDGVLRASGNADVNGSYLVTVSGLAEGQHTITASLMDPSTSYISDVSGSLSIRVDYSAPLAPAPDLADSSDTGVSIIDNITNDASPTFVGNTEAGAKVELLFNNLIYPVAANSIGEWAVTPELFGDGWRWFNVRITDLAGNVSAISESTVVNLDTVGVSLTMPIQFHFNTPPQKLTMEFSDDVYATISSTDLTVADLGTLEHLGVTLDYDSDEHQATYTFNSGVLPKGDFRASISPFAITDVAGNGVIGSPALNFFFLPGDANHDRKVDVSDLGILATNWQGSNRTFSEGDFTYDRRVDVSDLGVLATNWQQALALPSAPSAAAGSTPTNRTLVDQLEL
jgi:hypothetical protein